MAGLRVRPYPRSCRHPGASWQHSGGLGSGLPGALQFPGRANQEFPLCSFLAWSNLLQSLKRAATDILGLSKAGCRDPVTYVKIKCYQSLRCLFTDDIKRDLIGSFALEPFPTPTSV